MDDLCENIFQYGVLRTSKQNNIVLYHKILYIQSNIDMKEIVHSARRTRGIV